MGIGGSGLSDRMSIDDSELSLISATSSGTIIFQSFYGDVDVNGVDQATDIQRSNNANIKIEADAEKTITFKQSESTFAALSVTSANDITSNALINLVFLDFVLPVTRLEYVCIDLQYKGFGTEKFRIVMVKLQNAEM